MNSSYFQLHDRGSVVSTVRHSAKHLYIWIALSVLCSTVLFFYNVLKSLFLATIDLKMDNIVDIVKDIWNNLAVAFAIEPLLNIKPFYYEMVN